MGYNCLSLLFLESLVMNTHKIAHLSVIYVTNPDLVRLAQETYQSVPKAIFKLAVVNANPVGFEVSNWTTETLHNTENCLSLAWNKGIERLKDLGCRYVFATNLDVLVSKSLLKSLYLLLKKQPTFGMVSATSVESYPDYRRLIQAKSPYSTFEPIEHGDGSFSCFLLDIEAFAKVGPFDVNFKPAYFEDNDYLERLWSCGYTPQRITNQYYFHHQQGTLKTCRETLLAYPAFMQRNLEYFQQKHGKTPEHLPADVSFITSASGAQQNRDMDKE